MHPPAASETILKRRALTTRVRERLAIDRWPVAEERLPSGTALVGGAIRDALLDRLPERPDLDLVVPRDALALTRSLSHELGGSCVVLDEERDIARLVLRGWTIDIARQEGATLEDDLLRRDYRVNAIALPLQGDHDLVDPTGGINDLTEGRLTAVSEGNLRNDPLRLLRGLRLMAEIALVLEPTTAAWIKGLRHHLPSAAPERILAELQKLVAGPQADLAIDKLLALDLLAPWAASEPLPSQQDAAAMTTNERRLALPLARLTGLISDQGLEQLRASRALQQRCRRLRSWRQSIPDDPETLDERDRLQLQLDLEADLPALILQLSRPLQQRWLNRWRDFDDPLFHPRFPVDGKTLIKQLQLSPGPQIGTLLAHLRQEAAFGRIEGQGAALAEAQRWWSETRAAL